MPCRLAISSHSLGRAWVHDLPSKLDQAARHGLDIELFYEDLQYVARSLQGGLTPANLINAAHVVRSLCDQRNITIMCLQPFMNYEGLRDRKRHAQRIEEMELWMQLANILGTKVIAIPSTILPKEQMSGDMDLIVSDFREIADLGAPQGIVFSFEALSWGTYIDRWEQSWDVVTRVDRPNFGICFDTFNLAGRVYADPTTPNRKTPNADADIAASVQRLIRDVDVNKIVYVQVVDAEYLAEPLLPGHEFHNANQPPRMSWSRNCRLFYGEHDRGAYLPLRPILHALLVDLRFDGWISAELFSRSLFNPDPAVPAEHARRCAESFGKLVRDFDLSVAEKKPQRHPNSRRVTSLAEQQPRAQL